MTKSENSIQFTREGNVAMIAMGSDRPGNVLDAFRLELLRTLLVEARDDASLRVLILTGKGDEVFSNGVDVDAFAALDDSESASYRSVAGECGVLIDSFPKPVIAAINGRTAGLGLDLALACHIRIAAPNVLFVVSELAAGVPPVCGFSTRLGRLIGKARALELMLLGNSLSATRALELGLINRIEERGAVLDGALELGESLARNAPLATRFALEINRRVGAMEFHEALELETERFSECFDSEDVREGVRAFLEKRSPRFKGR